MNQKLVGIISVVLAYLFAIFFSISVSMDKGSRISPDAQLPMHISNKYSDVQLLHYYGYISNDEFRSVSDYPEDNLSLEEYNALLDQLLEGRKNELTESYHLLEVDQAQFGKS